MQRVYVVLGHADLGGRIDEDCLLRVEKINSVEEKGENFLLLAGGKKSFFPYTEAKQMGDLVRGWDEERILFEEQSHTTAENAWFAVSLLTSEVQEIILVCSRPHSIRARIFFSRALKYFGYGCKIQYLYSQTPNWKSWLYEFRYLHHIPRNIRSAREKYRTSA